MTASPPPRPIPAPPETLADLRSLAVAISRGQSPMSLGAKAHTALSQLLEMIGDPVLLSITTLAESLAVNPSTLTRLARSLGYSGFPALQQVLLSASMTAPRAFYSQQACRTLARGGSAHDRAAQLCHENQANIERFIENFHEPSFEMAVKMICTAPRVAVHGIRQFHAVASFLVYGLRMIRSDVVLLDDNSSGTAEGLALLGRDGVLISTSCAPYSTEVVKVANVAREMGIDTIALTDITQSPLVDSSRAAILVSHKTSFLSNSIGAFVVAVECVINACAAASPKTARQALTKREATISMLQIERL